MFLRSRPMVKTVLIIDDDPSLIRQVRARLAYREQLRVVHAETSGSGLDNTERDRPDLLILDWVLPDIQGTDVLMQLRSSKKTREIPMLMLTDRNNVGEIDDAFSLGADGYLTKPYSPQRLDGKVTELLSD